MFKNMFKRSWLSIIRKPSRTIILGLVLFAMANLVLSAIAIKSAVRESTAYAKNSIGGTVYLQPDMDKIREQMETSGQRRPGETVRIVRPTVPLNIATEIANEKDYVRDYSWSVRATAEAVNYDLVESENNAPNGGAMMRPTAGGGGFLIGGDGTTVVINGINSYAFIEQVEAGTMTIKDGNFFDETTNGQVMISVDLSDENDLKTGDKIKLKNTSTNKNVEVEIIGIYDVTDERFDVNAIYTNIDVAMKFLDEESYNGGNVGLQSVRFFMNNAEYADDFIHKMNSKFPELHESNLALSVDDSSYQTMVGPIEQVGSFANTILQIVVIASAVIVTLVVMINVKDRRYEMGVLLSMGATKLNIAGQIVVELIFIGTMGFVLSIGTSSVLAQNIGDGLLNGQVANSQKEAEQNFGRPGTAVGMGQARNRGPVQIGGFGENMNSDAEIIDEIDVKVSSENYALLFIIGYGVIIASLVVPTIGVFRFQPKIILTGKE
jgi:ABC-type transport system, involved in lipoprotein release, permease component